MAVGDNYYFLIRTENDMYYSKVEICGVNTSRLKVLSDDEKRNLLLLARDGDESARDELIEGNLRLVLSIIQRFAGRKENADDLFQVGCIGLIKAIDNFNTELDVKFSTYAVPMNIQCGKQSGIAVVSSNRRFWICRTTVLLGVVN